MADKDYQDKKHKPGVFKEYGPTTINRASRKIMQDIEGMDTSAFKKEFLKKKKIKK